MKNILLAVSLLILTGCGTTAKFVYPSKMKNLVQLDTEPILHQTVAVLPFDDFRGNENSMMMALYLIPLMPYGYSTYDRPEAAHGFLSIASFECDVSEDLAKAFATSLRRSNLFNNAYFTFGGEKDNADFNISSEVNEMFYKGRIFSYGLSLYGPCLWLFGAPAGTVQNKIDLTLYLRKSGSQKILWEYNIKNEIWFNEWLYYRMGWDVKSFAEMLEQGYNEAILDLQKQIRSNPNILK